MKLKPKKIRLLTHLNWTYKPSIYITCSIPFCDQPSSWRAELPYPPLEDYQLCIYLCSEHFRAINQNKPEEEGIWTGTN